MQRYDRLLQMLTHEPDLAADQALGEALFVTDPQTAEKLIAALVKRGHDEGLVWLIRVYHRLDSACRRKLLEACAFSFRALQLAVRDPFPHTKANAARLIAVTANPRLAYLLSILIHDESPAVRELAACAFQNLARQMLAMLKPRPSAAADPAHCRPTDPRRQEDLRQFLDALQAALDSFDAHLRTEVVEVAMLFADYLSFRTWQLFTAPRSRIARAAVEILHRSSDPQMVGFVYRALACPNLAAAVTEILSAQTNQLFMQEWIQRSYLALDAPVRKSLARIKELRWLDDDGRRMLALPAKLQARFIQLIAYTSLPAARKLQLIQRLLNSQNEQVQERALWALLPIRRAEVDNVLISLCNRDAETYRLSDRLMRVVYHELNIRKPQLLADLKRRSLRVFEELAGPPAKHFKHTRYTEYFQQFWHAYDKLPSRQRQRTADALRKLDPRLSAHLAEKLNSPRPADRVKALKIARQLRLTGALADLVYDLCEDPDERVRSCAVAALADLTGAKSRQLLVEALNDPNPRVQANAVQALGSLESRQVNDLLHWKLRSRHNRICANAVKAILQGQFAAALQTLLGMLDHPQPRFRRSALWVVTSTQLLNLVAKLQDLADADPDPAVRQLAANALYRLSAAAGRRREPEKTLVHAGVPR